MCVCEWAPGLLRVRCLALVSLSVVSIKGTGFIQSDLHGHPAADRNSAPVDLLDLEGGDVEPLERQHLLCCITVSSVEYHIIIHLFIEHRSQSQGHFTKP